jgi:ABC-type glycerol-3-phosphate transport system substrate-binding protein
MPSPIEEAALASTGGWGGGTIHLFGGGKAAMALGGRWWLCALRGETFPDLELGAVPCPFGPKKVYHGYARATLINRHGPRRDHALQFLLYEAGREYNMLVNHQADALAPVRKYAFTREYLHDPGYPEEDFNAVWRDVMEYGVPDQVSPFINGHRANTILTRQLDLVRNDQKPVADALAAAARQINEEILETVKRDPELHRTYCRLTGEDPL